MWQPADRPACSGWQEDAQYEEIRRQLEGHIRQLKIFATLSLGATLASFVLSCCLEGYRGQLLAQAQVDLDRDVAHLQSREVLREREDIEPLLPRGSVSGTDDGVAVDPEALVLLGDQGESRGGPWALMAALDPRATVPSLHLPQWQADGLQARG